MTNKNWLKKLSLVALALMLALSVGALGGCEGDDGAAGPAGAPGADGADGPAGPPGPGVQSYVGSAACSECHSAYYQSFVSSGHNFKLNKVIANSMPSYPFTDLTGALALVTDNDADPADPGAGTDNSLGTPLSYADVSYVIGGYGWKARFIDADGFIVTGSAVQYNVADGSMSGYHDNEVDKPYNCGNCHTTGWKRTTDDSAGDFRNLAQQDNLPGMDGTFALQGIQCESCHGAGGGHVSLAQAGADVGLIVNSITRVASARTKADFDAGDMAYGQAVACGECHTRDGEKDYPSFTSAYETASGIPNTVGGRIAASGGLIRHHEQYDELLGVNPDLPADGSTRSAAFQSAKFGCTGCHDPHTTTKFQDVSGDAPGVAASCESCHPNNVITSGGMAGFDCEECHMPRLAKSAIVTGAFTGSDGATQRSLGDIRSHILRIDLTKDPDTEQFSADGFSYPWITGEYACRRCHSPEGVSVLELTFPSNQTIH